AGCARSDAAADRYLKARHRRRYCGEFAGGESRRKLELRQPRFLGVEGGKIGFLGSDELYLDMVAVGIEDVDLAVLRSRHDGDLIGGVPLAKAREEIRQPRRTESKMLDARLVARRGLAHFHQVDRGLLAAIEPCTPKFEGRPGAILQTQDVPIEPAQRRQVGGADVDVVQYLKHRGSLQNFSAHGRRSSSCVQALLAWRWSCQ